MTYIKHHPSKEILFVVGQCTQSNKVNVSCSNIVLCFVSIEQCPVVYLGHNWSMVCTIVPLLSVLSISWKYGSIDAYHFVSQHALSQRMNCPTWNSILSLYSTWNYNNSNGDEFEKVWFYNYATIYKWARAEYYQRTNCKAFGFSSLHNPGSMVRTYTYVRSQTSIGPPVSGIDRSV